MSSFTQSSEARQSFCMQQDSGASLRLADEDICPYVVRGAARAYIGSSALVFVQFSSVRNIYLLNFW
jgi:hypothetical protein